MTIFGAGMNEHECSFQILGHCDVFCGNEVTWPSSEALHLRVSEDCDTVADIPRPYRFQH